MHDQLLLGWSLYRLGNMERAKAAFVKGLTIAPSSLELQNGLARVYVDHGDGTITDTRTGLMWEKLSDDGGIHDKDNVYSWGDAFAVKVAAFNMGPGLRGTPTGGCRT